MSVNLSPLFNDQTFNSDGDPAVGYQLFTYAAGSSTKLTTYTDAAGSVPQTNPIVLNASGYPTNGPIWLTAGQSYKFVLALSTDGDPPSSPVKTIDGVTGVNDSSATVTQWASSGVTPTYISATSFSLAGDQTTDFHVGRRIQATTSGGTVYGVITVAAYTSLTTITVLNDSGVFDFGLSVVNLSILRNDHPALPSVISSNVQSQSATRFTAGGTVDAITGSLSPPITAYASGLRVTTTVAANTVTGPTLNLNGLGAKTIKKRDVSGTKAVLSAGDYNASGPADFEYDGTDFILLTIASGEITGVVKDYIGTTAPSGYVLLSGRTIGSASSGATERANGDTAALYTLLWDSMADSEAAVSGGRGASAAADFAANKTIVLPDARGRVIVGKDNMGGTTASRITSGGSGITGTTLGASGGAETHTLITAEIPAHTHDNNAGVHTTGAGGLTGGSIAAAGSAPTGSTGGGGAHYNTQPTLVLNKIIKL